jgi:hypothetical protein
VARSSGLSRTGGCCASAGWQPAGSAPALRLIYGNETSGIAVAVGVGYTDVKWTACGGCGTYTSEESLDSGVFQSRVDAKGMIHSNSHPALG